MAVASDTAATCRRPLGGNRCRGNKPCQGRQPPEAGAVGPPLQGMLPRHTRPPRSTADPCDRTFSGIFARIHAAVNIRGRFEYPDLVAAASALWRKWKLAGTYTYLVIEDKGSGSSLIQSLKKERIYAHQHHAKLEGDKVMRLTAQAAHFHAGVVHFREDAPWLDELMAELLGFPGVRHDDQVDSISQALAFVNWRESHRASCQELRL
jgi:predicted phage terminase large subunit-like protein